MRMLTANLNELTNGKMIKVFSKYFLCGLLSNLIIVLGDNLVMVFESNLGSNYLALIGNLEYDINHIFSMGMIIGIGGSVLLTLKLGTGQKEKAERILGNSITLLTVISIITFLVAYINKDFFLLKYMLSFDGINTVNKYFMARVSGIVFVLLARYLITFIVAVGNPVLALLLSIISSILKLLAVFFYVQFNLDIVYRGLLLNLVDLITVIFIFIYFLRYSTAVIQLKLESLKIKKVSLHILSLGLFPLLFMVGETIYYYFMVSRTGYTTDEAISISLVNQFAFMPARLIVSTVGWLRPIFSYNYIRHKLIRVKKMVYWLGILLPLFSFVLLVPFVFYKNILNHLDYQDSLRNILQYYVIIIPIFLFENVILVYLQSVAKKLKLSLIYIVNLLLLAIPIYYMWRYSISVALNSTLMLNTIISILMFFIAMLFWLSELRGLSNQTLKQDNILKV